MNRSHPVVIVFLLLAPWIAPRSSCAGDSEDHLARIKAMSRVDRARMSKVLEDFDALDRPTRDSVRELNERLADLDPKPRARYIEIMRRYHVFYQTLPKEKREALDRETDSTKKLALIATYRAEQKSQPISSSLLADDIQVSTLSPQRLRGMARHLIVYFSLDKEKEAKEFEEFARARNPSDRETLCKKIMAKKEPADRQVLREKLREEAEEFLAAEETVRKDPILSKRLLKGQSEATKANNQAKKTDAARGKGADSKTDEVSKVREQTIRALDEQQVLRDLDAEFVSQATLDRFEAVLPSWARESLDALPPTAARRRLKALYRLVYPSPEEMPIPKSAAPAKVAKPSAPGGSGVNPF